MESGAMKDSESANIALVTYLLRHYSNDFILCVCVRVHYIPSFISLIKKLFQSK